MRWDYLQIITKNPLLEVFLTEVDFSIYDAIEFRDWAYRFVFVYTGWVFKQLC